MNVYTAYPSFLAVLSKSTGERGGSVVECRTPEREVGGSKPTAAVLCPWARHFTPRKYWLIIQEAVAPSRHDCKIVDWDIKPQHKQTNCQSLHCFPFYALWSGSTLFVILSSLIRVCTFCHSQSGQGLRTLAFVLCCIIKVYTVCHSQQSDQGLHYLPFFPGSIIKVYTVAIFQLSDQGLHCFPLLSCLIRVYTDCISQQCDQGLQ